MNDLQYVQAAIAAATRYASALAKWKAANTATREPKEWNSPEAILASREELGRAADELAAYVAKRLDELGQEHLATSPGRWSREWYAEIIEAIGSAGPATDKALYANQQRRIELAALANSVANTPAPEAETGGGEGGGAGDVEREAEVIRRLELLGDDTGMRVHEIAGRADLSVEQKLALIYQVDVRYLGNTSAEWAELLGVSDAAIRKTSWWQNERKRLKE